MQFFKLVSVTALAALVGAQSVSVNLEQLNALTGSAQSACDSIYASLSSLSGDWDSFKSGSSGAGVDELGVKYDDLWSAGSTLQSICADIVSAQTQMASDYASSDDSIADNFW